MSQGMLAASTGEDKEKNSPLESAFFLSNLADTII